MKILFYIEVNFQFWQKRSPHPTFLFFAFSQNSDSSQNTGYFVNLNVSFAFSSNVGATLFVTWLEFSIEFNKIFNIALKNFVLISDKVTSIVTQKSLERFTMHVSLRVYAFHCMLCLFIKEQIAKFLKVDYTVDKNSPLK